MNNYEKIGRHFPTCTHLEALYRDEVAIDGEGNLRTATGLSSINNLLTLQHLVKTELPAQTLEVGLAYGGSALAILSTLDSVHKREAFHHTAIDPFQQDFASAGINLVRDEGYKDKFQCIEELSTKALPNLLEAGSQFDLIYVDGSHIFENVFIDAIFSLMLLRNNGILVFDDCSDPHIAKVIRFLDSNLSEQLEQLPLEIKTIKKPLYKRIANRFGYAQMKGYRKCGDLPRRWDAPLAKF